MKMKCDSFLRCCGRLGIIGPVVLYAFSIFAAPTNLRPATDEAKPVPLLSDLLHDYFYNLSKEEREAVIKNPKSRAGYENANTNTFSVGTPVTFSWEGTSGECTVTVRRIGADRAFHTVTVSGTSVEIVNLEIDAGYEWSVTEKTSGATASACLWTSNEPPRLIKSGTMRLMRDLGGWKGLKDCRIRQNQIFRGGPANYGCTVDDAARTFWFDVVGLKSEIDFRPLSEAKGQGTPYQLDPDGKHVTYHTKDFTMCTFYDPKTQTGSGEGKRFVEAVRMLMNIGGTYRPAYFHCKSARDRTGTMAAFILALLGVSEDDIWRDYEASFTSGRFPYVTNFSSYLNKLKGYTKSGLTESARQYCLDAGITDGQIEKFREEMLIGYGEPPAPECRVEEPVYVTATRVTFAAGQATEEQYTGFETKKGRWYAWGRDGKAETEWKQGAGAPLELAKPNEEETWELMVRE